MYGHIRTLAEAEKKGVEKAGVAVDLFQIPETLPDDVLSKMHAPPKPTDITVLEDPATLEQYDAFLIGIPTRYGNFPAQWKVRLIFSPFDLATMQVKRTRMRSSKGLTIMFLQ
jgi:NAD(P)H dehydrogenase (quinone)